MRTIDILKNEYPGDSAWQNFYDVFKDGWNSVKNQAEYLREIPDEKIATVLAVKMGERGLSWFFSPSNALDGNTPSQIMSTGQQGEMAIKTLIMRLP